jgi:hypothetical protein
VCQWIHDTCELSLHDGKFGVWCTMGPMTTACVPFFLAKYSNSGHSTQFYSFYLLQVRAFRNPVFTVFFQKRKNALL